MSAGNHCLTPEIKEKLNLENFSILIINSDFKVVFANKKFCAEKGLENEKISNMFCFKISHDYDSICRSPNDTCPILMLKGDGTPHTEEHNHMGPKGKSRVLVTAIEMPLGNETHYIHLTFPYLENEEQTSIIEEARRTVESVFA